MYTKLKTLPIISLTFLLALVFAAVFAPAHGAFAVSTTTNFACSDGTTAVTLTKDTKNKAIVAKCSDGSTIDYLDYQNTGVQPVGVAVTCPGTQQIDPEVDVPNQLTSKMTFYCVTTGGTASDPTSKRSGAMPTAKTTAATGITCPDGTTPKDGNVQNCVNSSAANTPDPALHGNCSDVSKCDLINDYIQPFVDFLAALVGVAVVAGIIIGGIQYAGSAGDPSKVTAAKGRIRNSLLALVVFLILTTLLNFLIPGGIL